jgi:hypothetical protein
MIEPILKDIFEVPLVNKNLFQYELFASPDSIIRKNIIKRGSNDGNRLICERMKKIYDIIKTHNKNKIKVTEIIKNSTLFNLNNTIDSKLHLYFYNKITNNLLLNTKLTKKLVITSGIDDVKNLSKYNLDIIFTYNNLKSFYDLFGEIKSKYNLNIIDCTTNTKLSEFIKNTSNKYDFIYINNILVNYDYFIPTISLIAKLPLFLFIVLNSLLILNNNASIFITFNQGHIFNIPSIQKVFTLLINLFDKYEIIDYDNLFVNIKFSKFKGLDNKTKEDVNKLINICDELKSEIFSQDDLVSCLLSGIFFYYPPKNDISIEKIKKKILYDFDNYIIPTKNNDLLTNLSDITNKMYVKRNYYYNKISININLGYILHLEDNIFNIFIILNKYNLLDNILYKKLFEYEIKDFNNLIHKLNNTNIILKITNRHSLKSLKDTSNHDSDNLENLLKEHSPFLSNLSLKKTKESFTYKNRHKTLKNNLFDIMKNLNMLYQENIYILNMKKELNFENINNHFKSILNNFQYSNILKSNKQIIKYESDNNLRSNIDIKNRVKFLDINKLPKLQDINNVLDYIKFNDIYISSLAIQKNVKLQDILIEINRTQCMSNYIEWMKQIIFDLLFVLVINKLNINYITTIKLIECDIICKNANICLFLIKILGIYSELFKNVYFCKDTENGLENVSFKIIGENYIPQNNQNLINKLLNNYNLDILDIGLPINIKNNKQIIKFLEDIIQYRNDINIQLNRIDRCFKNKLGNCLSAK